MCILEGKKPAGERERQRGVGGPSDRRRHGEGRVLPRQASPVRADGVLHGGHGGFSSGLVAAGARSLRGRVGAVRFDLQLHLH